MGNTSYPLASDTTATYFSKPGLHGHNAARRGEQPSGLSILFYVRIVLVVLGCLGIGYYGYVLSNEYVYQAYQNWAFDEQIAGRAQVNFADYLRERTPFAFLAGGATASPALTREQGRPSANPKDVPQLATGGLVGRIAISRLNLSAMVREGVDADTLSKAVGHVPSTALPGQPGNFAIAAHRDTLFRALKDIQRDDLVTFQSTAGTYSYKVLATRIVQPSDISVLRPDGGGLIPGSVSQPANSLLTMITCYPFYYVGSAPKRFIVEGQLVSTDANAVLPVSQDTIRAANRPPHPNVAPGRVSHPPAKARVIRQAASKAPRHPGGSFRLRASKGSFEVSATFPSSDKRSKKHGFWHKLFHGD